MKLSVLLNEAEFSDYLRVRSLPNCPETFQRFLKEIGTTQIVVNHDSNSFVEVPPGSCIRLYVPRPQKQDKSQRSSSCVIV